MRQTAQHALTLLLKDETVNTWLDARATLIVGRSSYGAGDRQFYNAKTQAMVMLIAEVQLVNTQSRPLQ